MKTLIVLLSVLALKAFAQTTIKVDGSSTVYPITEAMAEEFQTQKKNSVKVTAGISGTGGGFKKFCRGETDIQGASRPITKTEMEDCKKVGVQYIELPIAYDATVVAVNVKNTWLKEISVADLKKMWEPSAMSTIKKWNQVNPAWPDAEFKLFGAGSDSGTFDYFTEAIMGKAKSSRGDYTASEDDNTLVKGIAGEKNSLGYLPMSYFIENKKTLRAVAIIGGEKAPLKTGVQASKETVENGTYYPLSRPLFIYVSVSAAKRPEVTEFVKFYLANASRMVPEVKYVALPAKAYTMGLEHFTKGKIGTVFATGSHVGLKIEELMKKEASF
jgi:phosphate transport system substrate-binding protein